jgi:hypothetical protein
LVSYVHCNPVRAGVVAAADESNWTSHRAYLGVARKPPWLDVQLGLDLCGFSTGQELDAYTRTTPIDRKALDAVSLNQSLRRGRPAKSLEDECSREDLKLEAAAA